MNSTFVGSGLLSDQFLADSSVPTLPVTNSLGEVSPDDVSSMTEIRRIIEPRDRSIDSSPTDRTDPKAQLREVDLMNCKLSALVTIASTEVFPQPDLSLDAIASASRVLDIPRTHSYLDTNSSTANSSAMQTLYCNAFQPQYVIRSECLPGALNLTAPDCSATQILTRILSYLDKCSLENGLLEAYLNSILSFAAVPVSNSTSRRLE